MSRQIRILCEHFKVTAAGFADPQLSGVEFVPVKSPFWSSSDKAKAATALTLRRFESAYWSSQSVKSAHNLLAGRSFDLILSNDINTLPLALRLKQTARILFDAHEYSPLEFAESWRWRFFLQKYNEYLCRTYIPKVDAMTTVCDGIAQEYLKNYGVTPMVVLNTPTHAPFLPPSPAHGKVRLVHHGAAIPSRRLEQMLEIMPHLDNRFTLDLMLVPSVPRYVDKLKALAAHARRTNIRPPADSRDLVAALNQYDMGIYLLEPNNFNNLHSLPNKFFDFIQARLGIAIGPSPEMARYVKQFDCGIVSDSFEPRAFAKQLNRLSSEQIQYFQQRSHAAAESLCFEKSAERLLDLISRTLAAD